MSSPLRRSGSCWKRRLVRGKGIAASRCSRSVLGRQITVAARAAHHDRVLTREVPEARERSLVIEDRDGLRALGIERRSRLARLRTLSSLAKNIDRRSLAWTREEREHQRLKRRRRVARIGGRPDQRAVLEDRVKARRAEITCPSRFSRTSREGPATAGRPTRGSAGVGLWKLVRHQHATDAAGLATAMPAAVAAQALDAEPVRDPDHPVLRPATPVSCTTSPTLKSGCVAQPDPGTPFAYGLTAVVNPSAHPAGPPRRPPATHRWPRPLARRNAWKRILRTSPLSCDTSAPSVGASIRRAHYSGGRKMRSQIGPLFGLIRPAAVAFDCASARGAEMAAACLGATARRWIIGPGAGRNQVDGVPCCYRTGSSPIEVLWASRRSSVPRDVGSAGGPASHAPSTSTSTSARTQRLPGVWAVSASGAYARDRQRPGAAGVQREALCERWMRDWTSPVELAFEHGQMA